MRNHFVIFYLSFSWCGNRSMQIGRCEIAYFFHYWSIVGHAIIRLMWIDFMCTMYIWWKSKCPKRIDGKIRLFGQYTSRWWFVWHIYYMVTWRAYSIWYAESHSGSCCINVRRNVTQNIPTISRFNFYNVVHVSISIQVRIRLNKRTIVCVCMCKQYISSRNTHTK